MTISRTDSYRNEGARRGHPKGHRAKVRLARRLRQETSLSLKWIAQRLHIGSWI